MAYRDPVCDSLKQRRSDPTATDRTEYMFKLTLPTLTITMGMTDTSAPKSANQKAIHDHSQ